MATLYSDNHLIEGLLTLNAKVTVPTSTATTASGTLTLTSTSTMTQVLTGTATGYSVVLPSALTLALGQRYEIFNTSSQSVTIKTNGGATLLTLAAGYIALIGLRVAGTAAGTWMYFIGATSVAAAAGNQGDVQFRGAAAGSFAANAAGYFRWDDTLGSLQIGPTGGPAFSNNPLGVAASVNNFAQVNVQNLSNGGSASSDVVCTMDTGTDGSGYIDLGINGSGYNDPAYSVNGPGDGYLYCDGNLGVGSSAKDLILFAGGTLAANEVARCAAAGYFQQNLGRVHVPTVTATANNTTYTLTSTSPSLQILTGTGTNCTVVLPSALTLTVGQIYEVYNQSSNSVILKNGANATLTYVPPTAAIFCILQADGSAGGTWITYGNTIGTAAGIVNYKVTSSTAFTSASASDVVITGFTVTPTQGTYAVWYNASISIMTNNTLLRSTIYKNGVAITDSVRASQGSSSNWVGTASSMTTATFSGTDTCDVRVRSTSGNITVNDRSLILTRLGN
jgi:hypothetical protein